MKKYAFYDVEFGVLKVGYTDTAIFSLDSVVAQDCENEPSKATDLVFTQISEYINGDRERFDLHYTLEGTEFQKKVWEALCSIPFAETRTYKQIAELISNPKAYRAVGSANNKNPLLIVVPCHRVIGAKGDLVGYRSGMEMKKKLIELERSYKNKKQSL